jgi:hypothetical protein
VVNLHADLILEEPWAMDLSRSWMTIAAMGAMLLLAACGPKRPVFYPNGHLESVGPDQARADADECMAEAKAYGVQNDAGKQVGGKAVKGAAIGAAASAIGAAVFAGDVGRAIGAGAAGGAAAGAISGAFDADEPSPVFRQYVDHCLREKGYEVIGWQ